MVRLRRVVNPNAPSQYANRVKKNCLEYFVEKGTLYVAGSPALSRARIDAGFRIAKTVEAYFVGYRRKSVLHVTD